MTIVALLNVFALVAYSALAMRILTKRPRTALNWTAALVLAALTVWSVEDVVHGIPSASLGLARLFEDIGSVGWGTFASLILVFALVLTGRRRVLKSWPIYIPLAGLPALTIYAQFTGHLNASYVLGRYGWATVWPTSWPTYTYYAHYIGFVLVSLFLFWQFRRRAQHWRERRQATLMLSTASAALGLGLTDYVIRQITHLPIPDLAGVLVVIWAAGLYLAVTRYGLMSVTPQAAADDILATMPDALLLLGPNGEFVRANQAALDLFSYPAGALAGKHAELLFAEPATFRATLARIAGGEPVSALEFDCCARDGRLVPVSFSGRVMRDRGGESVGIVVVLQDISVRRLADAELRLVQQELVARERLATIGQVAGSIAHEIRNPLGAIRNAAYFLKLTAGDKLTGKAAKHLEIISDEIDRCNRIITGLLDFVQGRTCEPHACRLADILSAATARAGLPRMTEVQTRLPRDLPLVRVDADQMEQVFHHLITNAHQAMANGGKVTIAATRSDGVVRVAVSDSGAGITPENRARLFEPLFSTRAFGVGLGLPICKTFIEANKGTINVESEVGKGTTVTVVLPAAERQTLNSKLQDRGQTLNPKL